ncbi:MAG: MFS transporter [Bacillota bacterium]
MNSKSRTLLFMCFFIFLMSVGEGMTAPAIPLYGDVLGASYIQLGFLMTGYSIAYTIMTLVSGRFSDSLGRKRILLFSIALSILASAGYYFSSTPIALLLFRTMEGMSRGILWPVAEAVIADNSTFEDRERVMGRFSAAYGLGVTFGTFIGGYVMEYVGLTAVFPVYPLLAMLVMFAVLYGVSEAAHSEGHHGLGVFSLDIAKSEVKKIWAVCYIGFAYSGFLYSLWGLLSKVANSFGVSPKGIGLIFALFWGTRVVSFLICGGLADLIGRKRVFVAGVMFCVLSTGTFLAADSLELFFTAALLGGIGTGIIFPLSLAYVADYSSPSNRGFGMGFLEFIMGIGMITQTAISGIIGDLGGVQLTYVFTFLVLLGAVPISMCFIREPQRDHNTLSC